MAFLSYEESQETVRRVVATSGAMAITQEPPCHVHVTSMMGMEIYNEAAPGLLIMVSDIQAGPLSTNGLGYWMSTCL